MAKTLGRLSNILQAASFLSLPKRPCLSLCSSKSCLAEKSCPVSDINRTYGIPTISKLLCETQQLGKAEYAGRRYTDTSLLITEFIANSPTSERANSAIARMNYLHDRYQRAKKISNDDMLYTLSLFVLEVEKWIGLYEWRSLTPMEICAL